MTLLARVNYIDPRYTNTQRQIAEEEGAERRSELRVTELEESLEINQPVADLAEEMRNEMLDRLTDKYGPREFLSPQASHLYSQISSVGAEQSRTVARIKDSLLSAKLDISRCKTQITRLQETLESLGDDINRTLTKQSFAHVVRELPNIVPGSIAVGMEDESPFVQWTFTGITMKPDHNPHRWLVGGEIPEIPLQDIICKVQLFTGLVTLSPKPTERDLCLYYWGGTNRVQPHVLDNDKPCLGDWAGVIREATEDGDWVTLVATLNIFLSNAANQDQAGKQWIKYFNKAVNEHARDHGYSPHVGRHYITFQHRDGENEDVVVTNVTHNFPEAPTLEFAPFGDS